MLCSWCLLAAIEALIKTPVSMLMRKQKHAKGFAKERKYTEWRFQHEYEWRLQSHTSGDAVAEHKDKGSNNSHSDDNNEIASLESH